MLAFLLTASLAKYTLWEAPEPISMDLKFPQASSRELRRRLDMAKKHITEAQANAALHKTNCSDFVTKKAKKKMSLKASKKCWSYDYGSVPKGCPEHGWVKYDDFHFVQAKVGAAGIAVDENNKVGLVVRNVTLTLKPTKFTMQEHGIFTMPCGGIIKGIISGAANSVEALVNFTAEGIPVIGEGAASPVDGVVVKLEHQLDGLCGLLESLLSDIIGLLGGLLKDLLSEALPPIISELLGGILNMALSDLEPNGPSAALDWSGFA